MYYGKVQSINVAINANIPSVNASRDKGLWLQSTRNNRTIQKLTCPLLTFNVSIYPQGLVGTRWATQKKTSIGPYVESAAAKGSRMI